MDEMEQLRIETELEKQQAVVAGRGTEQQRDSGMGVESAGEEVGAARGGGGGRAAYQQVRTLKVDLIYLLREYCLYVLCTFNVHCTG